MKIRNDSNRVYCFNGGRIMPKRTVDIKDEKIAKALLKGYPNELKCVDSEVVEVIEPADEKEDLVAKAKELGVKGNVDGMKVETLKSKIAELEK